jgi:hypothetical protein
MHPKMIMVVARGFETERQHDRHTVQLRSLARGTDVPGAEGSHTAIRLARRLFVPIRLLPRHS